MLRYSNQIGVWSPFEVTLVADLPAGDPLFVECTGDGGTHADLLGAAFKACRGVECPAGIVSGPPAVQCTLLVDQALLVA